jgi:TRAP-type C4-dicarboxylate transport system permease small subunit
LVERTLWWCSRALSIVAVLALTLLLIQTVADVAMRAITGGPIQGNLEIMSAYHMVLLTFLPLGLLEMRREHITVDLMVRAFGPTARRVIETVAYLIAAGFYALMLYRTGHVALDAWSVGELLMTAVIVPIWPVKFVLPLGFLLALATVLLHAWQVATDPDFDLDGEPENLIDG